MRRGSKRATYCPYAPLFSQKRTGTLVGERGQMERSLVAQSERAQQLAQEVALLRDQLGQALAAADRATGPASGPGSDGAAAGDVTVDIGEGGLPVALGTPSKSTRPSTADRRGPAALLTKISERRELQGLVNCMQLVSDGRIGRRGSVVYLVAQHIIFVYLLVAFFRC